MKHSSIRLAAAGLLGLGMMVGMAYADKPEKGHGHGKHKDRGDQQEDRRGDDNDRYRDRGGRDSGGINASINFSFGGADIRTVRDYYGGQAAKGHCPPGLAKKGNGCQPPGQARKWHKGQALPRDLRYYDVPNELRIRLPAPPAGHKYVQMGADLLLIAVGTSIVVDAVQDIF
ncbi:RcnB family protein [Limnobacter humi]|uniref:RcnB family protein n=1 Tax=Limnobacter humi TaxID=1778671 RepID=A0ABT1WFY5_9BURK|nr:RcnB family protein [Limnobacter humi]MCQ8896432.1 RcnB family protein [Limnobacter humi]